MTTMQTARGGLGVVMFEKAMSRTTLGRSAVAALGLALAGCVGQDGGRGLSLEQTMGTPKFVALATPADPRPGPRAAAALPPAAGAVATIRDRRFADGFRQDVLLTGGALRGIANGITLLAHDDGNASEPLEIGRGTETLPFAKPTEASIATELRQQFSGVSMQVIARRFANAYGPYGLALGRGPKDVRCLYAWQWIDDQPRLARLAMAGPVSVRTRLCRDGQTFDAMARLMDGLALGRDASGAMPNAVSATGGEPLSDIVEAPSVGERKVAPVVSHRRVRHAGHAARPARHQRIVAETGPAEAPGPIARAPVPPNTGIRYMAPIAASPSDPSSAPSGAAPTAQAAPNPLSDLPPQAYLGPAAAKQVAVRVPSAGR